MLIEFLSDLVHQAASENAFAASAFSVKESLTRRCSLLCFTGILPPGFRRVLTAGSEKSPG